MASNPTSRGQRRARLCGLPLQRSAPLRNIARHGSCGPVFPVRRKDLHPTRQSGQRGERPAIQEVLLVVLSVVFAIKIVYTTCRWQYILHVSIKRETTHSTWASEPPPDQYYYDELTDKSMTPFRMHLIISCYVCHCASTNEVLTCNEYNNVGGHLIM